MANSPACIVYITSYNSDIVSRKRHDKTDLRLEVSSV